MERTPNESQHTKLTLEKKVLPPLLPGFELPTFRPRVRRSYQQAIPAPFHSVIDSGRIWRKDAGNRSPVCAASQSQTWVFIIYFCNSSCGKSVFSVAFSRPGGEVGQLGWKDVRRSLIFFPARRKYRPTWRRDDIVPECPLSLVTTRLPTGPLGQ